ncbi:DUF4845 domain-containing protein [Pseudomonas typographi]|uniref:DUF4845 domain-containing protein n=1 Tax=Pseudomonas typographi TaxID=2715964 RepID=A0ABR7YWD4_9PSED|nr:DUF4845 domain-containing protein [Pseudomonas typographi]MBD1552489.1 DUF4845 domain-containing protein [Pseudomonas typographi]MBD1585579.1 DUF4845 domain-containing protein [Pseudomonas typographi]MBD1597506.1 DUF4845 domain-containing protein [Pseudomonas typographi]
MEGVASQKGMSPLGWLFVVAVLACAVSLGLKLGPHYMTFWSLKKVMDRAATERADSASDFYQRVQRGVQVNGVEGLDLKKALSIEEQGGVIRAHLNYEKREHLVANLDLVLVFTHDTSVTAQ